jgi:Na+-driven multidrug efflux pump
VLVFGGIFALSGAIGGIFGQNFGAGQFDRLRSTYKDALIFCGIYTLVAWALMAFTWSFVADAFDLTAQGTEVLRAFTTFGVGGFVFIGALFVSNAAFNNLGKPLWSTLLNWINHGILSWPTAWALALVFGAPGVIYGQAVAGIIAGILAATWGWYYVRGLQPDAALDQIAPRDYPSPGAHPDRYRNR